MRHLARRADDGALDESGERDEAELRQALAELALELES